MFALLTSFCRVLADMLRCEIKSRGRHRHHLRVGTGAGREHPERQARTARARPASRAERLAVAGTVEEVGPEVHEAWVGKRASTIPGFSLNRYGALAEEAVVPANSLAVRRLRFVGNGLHEEILLQSFLNAPVHLEVRMAVANDFADLFEIKDYVRDRSAAIQRSQAENGDLTITYSTDGYAAQTIVQTSPGGRLDGKDLVWEVAYAGNKGTFLSVTSELNQLDPSYLALGSQLQQLVPNPFYGAPSAGGVSAACFTAGVLAASATSPS